MVSKEELRQHEIIEEIAEDLELKSGFILSKQDADLLRCNGRVFIAEDDFAPYVEKVAQYLLDTPPDARVWDVYKRLSVREYEIVIQVFE